MRLIGTLDAIALPTGEYAVRFPASHIETHRGRVDRPGFDLAYLDITNVGAFRIAGQAQVEPNDPRRGTWLWDGDWHKVSDSAHGVYPCIFAKDGTLVLADPAQHGSQGFRYVADDGRIVSGDDTLNDQRRVGLELGLDEMWEFTHLGGVTVGQGVEFHNGREAAGLRVIIDGVRRYAPEHHGEGDVHNVRMRYTNGTYAVSFLNRSTGSSYIYWLTRAELSMLPAVTQGPVIITPPPVTEPEKPPVSELPESLHADVVDERAKYPAELTIDQPAKILNAVAWKHRDKGWGLSVKKGGNRVPSPQGVDVAYDILHHKPSDTLWGCFTDELRATVNWGQEEHHHNPDRPWLAPVQPSGVSQPQPVAFHPYEGGGNDTGECDTIINGVRCGLPPSAPIHQQAPSQPPSEPMPSDALARLEAKLDRLSFHLGLR